MNYYEPLKIKQKNSFKGNSFVDTKPHIVIVVPRGEVIRNFLYSKTLDVLASQARVTVLSVIHNERITSHFRDQCEQIIPLELIKEHRVVRLLRQILEYSHERYIWSQPVQVRWRKRSARSETPLSQIKWLAKKTTAQAFATQVGLQLLSYVEHRVSDALKPTDKFVKQWLNLKPDLVFNGSHIHSPAAVLPLLAANQLQIPTATFLFSWDNLTSRGRIFLPYDHYLTWNDQMQGQLLKLYPSIQADQVTVTGSPQFDYHFDPAYLWSRDEFCRRIGADPNRPIVVYTTGMPNYMVEEPRVVAGIAKILRQMTDYGPPQLLVRVYPKDVSGRFNVLKRELPDVLFPDVPWDQEGIKVAPYHDDIALYTNTLYHSAVGLNVASTVSLELAMFDKPVINIAYDPPGVDIKPVSYAEYYNFDHYRPVVDSGAVQMAYSEVELVDHLHHALTYPEFHCRQRRCFIQNFFGPYLDGHAGERVGQCLLDLARSHLS